MFGTIAFISGLSVAGFYSYKFLIEKYQTRIAVFRELSMYDFLMNYFKIDMIGKYLEKYPLENNFLKSLQLNRDDVLKLLDKLKKNTEYYDKKYDFDNISNLIFNAFQTQMPLDVLGNLYKKVGGKEKYIALNEIKLRPPEGKFLPVVGYLPLIYSGENEFLHEKDIFLKGNFDPTQKFKNFCYQWLTNPSFELLTKYYHNLDVEHKIWVLPLFKQLVDAHKSLEFLLTEEENHLSSFSITTAIKTLFKKSEFSDLNESKYFNFELESTINYLISKLIPIEYKNHAFCVKCKRRLVEKGIKNYNYLLCPICESSAHTKFKLPEIKAVFYKEMENENEFVFWNSENKSIELIEADVIEVKRNETNLDWAISAFIQVYEDAFPKKKIKVKISHEIPLQDNTLRQIEKKHEIEKL